MTDAIVNVLHLLATAMWIGGALAIHFVFQPALAQIDPPQAAKAMGFLSKRFSIIAWSCILVLIVTGLVKTPEGMLTDTSSEVAMTLFIKHIFVLLVIVVGLIIAFVVVPRLRKAAPAPGEKPSDEFIAAQQRLAMLSKVNTLFGIAILVCASLLW